MKYDVVVIGGGPAGMMAAGQAGEQGARVLLLEKNKNLGVKLLITGKGRCNITNNTEDAREFVNQFGKNGKFLFSSLSQFGISDAIDFFESRGLKVKTERGNRVFPISDNSRDVLNVFVSYLRDFNVDVKTNAGVKKINVEDGKIKSVSLFDGGKIEADKFIICTGGRSYPRTGSSGDGYRWLKDLGHKIIPPAPSLVPVVVKDEVVKRLEGLSLKNVEISIYKNNKKLDSRFGEALFTGEGMSGPIILDMSKKIGENLPGKLKIQIDFKPALDFSKLDKRIQRDFEESSNRLFRNSLGELLPKKMIPVIIKMSGISPEKKVNSVTREERKNLIHLLKEFSLEIKSLDGFDNAIITAGGVALDEINPKTMQSKKISNLYLAGEILDLDGPTGGYNLQVCWSTGYVAGDNTI